MANPHYAIELSLMLYHKGEWARGFTYYNHGDKPPFGGVRSDETTEPLVLSLEEFENNVHAVEAWRRHVVNVVKSTNPVPKEGKPEIPLEYRIDPNTLEYQLVMASLEVVAVYDKDAETVTFAPRSAFDVTWQGFLYHQNTMLDFLDKIKEQS